VVRQSRRTAQHGISSPNAEGIGSSQVDNAFVVTSGSWLAHTPYALAYV
jgi:hypothetical protein